MSATAIGKELSGSQLLRNDWKTAIYRLKRSKLRKEGNPIYALPWILMLGPSGAGKSTALHNAGLSSFGETLARVTPTLRSDWYFFDQAVVIDTAGRYADSDTAQAGTEWNTILQLLTQWRRRQPLNSVVLSIPATQLLSDSAETLETLGKNLRQRIHQLMRATRSRVPIYVLVTQCDALAGMTAFFKGLSKTGLQQAMGFLNNDPQIDFDAIVQNTFTTVGARLKSMRMILAAQPGSNDLEPAALAFPETFAKLRIGVMSLLSTTFQDSVYQEAPFLRGIYFANSHFLHDFFAKILPADRTAIPTQQSLRWHRGLLNGGTVTGLLCVAALAGLFSLSFVRNMQALAILREANRAYQDVQLAPEDFGGRILSLDTLNETLVSLSRKNTGWMSHLGLRDVAGAETQARANLSATFHREYLMPLDRRYRQHVNDVTASSNDIEFSQLVSNHVQRIAVLRARLGGAVRPEFNSPVPRFPFLKTAGQRIDGDTEERFGHLYVSSVFWAANVTEVQNELTTLQAQLKRLLILKGRDPRWMIAWAAAQNSIPPITLSELWGRPVGLAHDISVPGLFSAQGKSLIDSFFQEIERALGEPAVSGELKTRFDRWYSENSAVAWRRFLQSFPKGIETLQTQENWRHLLPQISGDSGPYGVLSIRLLSQFESTPESELPVWVRHVRQTRSLRLTPAYLKYRQALEKTVKAVSDPTQEVQAVTQAFDSSLQPAGSVFGTAFEALAKLKAAAHRDLASDPAAWKLVSGPLDYLWDYARRETADRLQQDWQSKVLASATGLEGSQAMAVLLAKDGPAMRFAKDQAGPFMQWKPGTGFYAKESFGATVPFNSTFFAFLNGAVWASSVNNLQVTITDQSARPNAHAKRIPHISQLTLRCGGKDQDQVLRNRRLRVLENSFDSVEKTFTWSPACTQADLEIDIAGTRLVKRYPGSYGFFAFLHDFKTGQHTFTRNDFPDQAQALSELGVSSITMHYRLKGAPDFAAPKAAPSVIVWNWDR